MSSVFVGLGYNFTGLGFFFKNRKLWKWVLIPFFLDLVLGTLLIAVYVRHFAEIQTFFLRPFADWDVVDPQGIMQYLKDLGFWFLRGLMHIVIFFVTLLLLWLTVSLVTAIINAPFYEMLSEKVLILTGRREDLPFSWQRFKTEWWHATKIGFWRFLFLGLPGLVILLLSVLPGIGLVFTVVYFFYLSWCAAFGIVAYPMTLMHRPFGEILHLARKNFGLFFGFGLPALIPIVGPMLLSFQIVAGTLLYVEKTQTV